MTRCKMASAPIATIPPYTYDSLPYKRCIRLLKTTYAASNSGASTPTYSLHVIDLDESIPPYFAVSYTWGDPRGDAEVQLAPTSEVWGQSRSIIVDGREVVVGANLADFLNQMASTGQQYTHLWIDAICINQHDVEERNSQVQLMRDVYKTADRIIVWLGKDFINSAASTKLLLYELASKAEIVRELPMRFIRDLNDTTSLKRIGLAHWTEDQWLAVVFFLSRRWFRRLWCVQEVLLNARFVTSTAFLLGGTQLRLREMLFLYFTLKRSNLNVNLVTFMDEKRGSMKASVHDIGSELDTFAVIATLMRHDLTFQTIDKTALVAVSGTKEIQRTPSASFIAISWLLRDWEVTEPHDRIFAILGMYTQMCAANGITALKLRVDYGSSVGEVYLATTTLLLQDTGRNLNFLASAGKQSQAFIEGLPTWVLTFYGQKWATALLFASHEDGIHYNACKSGQGDDPLLRVEGCRLCLTGVMVGEISHVADCMVDNAAAEFSTLFDVLSRVSEVYQHTGEARSEAFRRTLVHNVENIYEGRIDPISRDSRDIFKAWLRWNLAMLGLVARVNPAKSEESWRTFVMAVDSMAQSDLGNNLPSRHEIRATLTEFGFDLESSDSDINEPAVESVIMRSATNRYHRDFKAAGIHRRLFTTDRQHLGLCPDEAQVGDQVWILNGALAPFILRPASSPDGAERVFELIGDAYVHGVMHGESVTSEDCFVPITLI